MIFDTHAHYDDEQFDTDRDELLSSMAAGGVGTIVDAAATVESWDKIVELAEKYSFIYGSVGVHPDEVGALNEENFARMRELLKKEKIVAVGEIGLDYYWDKEGHDLQKHWFIRQLDLAREMNKPVMIHSREAAADTMEIMKEHGKGLKGVIHCYSYSLEMAREYVKMGYYIGVGGVVTFKNSKKLKEIVEEIPLESIVLETDCPYLAPTPFRGKRNSSLYLPYVVEAIADVAGDFVMATAGADLESVLAGKGAGAAELSRKTEKMVANLDIGGGTTNICLFENGNVLDTACFDIGGRLVKVADGKITYVAPKIRWLSEQLGLEIAEGQNVEVKKLKVLTDAMAEILVEAVGLKDADVFIEKMKTNHAITCQKKPELITFSGGVASCFEEIGELFRYGDIGVLLAQSIRENPIFQKGNVCKAKETMRATVIGAGNYSMNISGSTIEYTEDTFPLKNIPVVKIALEQPEDIADLDEKLHRAMQIYQESRGEGRQIAIAMKGLKCPSFTQIQEIAEKLTEQYDRECEPDNVLIIVLEEDIGKALGQALHHRIKNRRKIICIDGIYCESGDFVDLGEPIVSGKVIPVIVKTLIFNG